MVQCVSAACVLGIVILGLLIMTGALEREQAGAAVGRIVAVTIFLWFAVCVMGMAFGAVLVLLKRAMAWLAIIALVIGLLLLVRVISIFKKLS
jgi:hypothetical protein